MDEIKQLLQVNPMIAVYIGLVLVYVICQFISRIRDDVERQEHEDESNKRRV